MATSGIGRPVVLNEDGIRALEHMLLRQQRLVRANKELLMRQASRRDYATVRTLSQVR